MGNTTWNLSRVAALVLFSVGIIAICALINKCESHQEPTPAVHEDAKKE